MQAGFVYLDTAVPGIFWEAKYATSDNFTGRIVTGYQANRVVGTLELAAALSQALNLAKQRDLGLLIWDAYRPQRAVNDFLRWAEAPEDNRTKQRHYPHIDRRDMVSLGYVAPKSGHSRGSAIDLTLCDPITGTPLNTGGIFDLMDPVSHHGAKGISREAERNRELLRAIMLESGFKEFECEWWHYSLVEEPYPDTYFDFPIDMPNGGSV